MGLSLSTPELSTNRKLVATTVCWHQHIWLYELIRNVPIASPLPRGHCLEDLPESRWKTNHLDSGSFWPSLQHANFD